MQELGSRPLAATLAVGTEVTDGQITDRNSATISVSLVKAGVKVIEHRSVADDRADIERALVDLAARVDLLFVTGGLGPTSDDFTREVLAACFGLPLEFHEESWRQIQAKFAARGLKISSTQKQQCYYPRNSRVLDNPAGTANGFTFDVSGGAIGATDRRKVRIHALPGPPAEVAAVWERNLRDEIEALVPASAREQLRIYRCIGQGEGALADLVEAVVAGSGLRVGYRAHVPYVEVKIWTDPAQAALAAPVLAELERTLAPWLVNRDDEDVADVFIDRVLAASVNQLVLIHDFATAGVLEERLSSRLRERRLFERDIPLIVQTAFSALTAPSASSALSMAAIAPTILTTITLLHEEASGVWKLRLNSGQEGVKELEIRPPSIYNPRSERARRFIAEKALHLLAEHGV